MAPLPSPTWGSQMEGYLAGPSGGVSEGSCGISWLPFRAALSLT